MSQQYESLLPDLRAAYDAQVAAREQMAIRDWKHRERERFLERLRAEGRTSLLEVGAGTGIHGRFFADAGLDVVCVDLSPAMVAACHAKGLEAYCQDFLHLDLPRQFDAAFALNCLLHVAPEDLPTALESIRTTLKRGALTYVGQYGGIDWQGSTPTTTTSPSATSHSSQTSICSQS
jgi:SAM-dependent methyltransferase